MTHCCGREHAIERRYCTLKDAAGYLGITEKALRHYVQRRTIPFCRVGTRLLFDRRALDRWLARRAVNVGEGAAPTRPE